MEKTKTTTARAKTVANAFVSFSLWIDDFIDSLDGRTVYGWGQIGVGAAILMSPYGAVSGNLTVWGFTSFFYACLLLGIGGYILAVPNTKHYPVLLLPFLLYITTLIHYVSTHPSTSLVSVVIYIAYWLNGLRAVRNG